MMKKETRNKILFFIPPVVLAVITWLWLFLVDGRWYSYKQEWPFLPLLILHLLFPLFYYVHSNDHKTHKQKYTVTFKYILYSLFNNTVNRMYRGVTYFPCFHKRFISCIKIPHKETYTRSLHYPRD